MRNQELGTTPAREFARFWRDPALDQLELLHASFYTQSFAPHSHDTYAIGILEGGSEYFDYRGRREMAGSGTIAIIHPGELHTGGALGSDGWRYRALYPDAKLISRMSAELGGTSKTLPYFRTPVIDDPELFGAFWRMHRALQADAPILERESRLLWALSTLIERYADPLPALRPLRPEHNAVATILDYLHEYLADTITLDTLSGLTQLSKYHLVRVFRDAMGLPPHAYLNQLRIERAKRLLLGGVAPADVAAQVGFSDQSHLTRLFKRTVGVTPGLVAPDRAAD